MDKFFLGILVLLVLFFGAIFYQDSQRRQVTENRELQCQEQGGIYVAGYKRSLVLCLSKDAVLINFKE